MSSQLQAHNEVAGESKKVYRKTRTSSATKLPPSAAAATREVGGGLPVAGRATGEGGAALAAALPVGVVGIAGKRERMTLEQIIREAGGRVPPVANPSPLSEKATAGHLQAHSSSAYLSSSRKDPNSLNFDKSDRGDETLQQRSSSKHKPLVLPSHQRSQTAGDKVLAASLGEGGGTRSYSVDSTWEEERGAQRRFVPPRGDNTVIHQSVNRGVTPQQHHRQDVNGLVLKGNGGVARMNSTRDIGDHRLNLLGGDTVLYGDNDTRRAEKSPIRSSSRERGHDLNNGGGGGRSASIVGQQTKVGGTSTAAGASPLRSLPGTTVSRGASSFSKRMAVEKKGVDVAEQRSPTLQYVSKIESELATLQDRHADLCRLMMEASAAHQLTCLEFAESEARKAAVSEPEEEERGMLGMWFHSTLRVFHSMGLERLRKDISNAYDDLVKSQRYVHKLEEKLEESQRSLLQHATGHNTNSNGAGGGGAALFSSSAVGSFALGGSTPMGKAAAASSGVGLVGETPLGPPAYLQIAQQQQQQQQQLASSSAGLNTSALSAATIAVVVNDAISAHHSRFQREFMQSFNETVQSLLDTNMKKGFETVGTHTTEVINKSATEHQKAFLADLLEEIEGKSRKAHTVVAEEAAQRQKYFEDKLSQLEEKRDGTLVKRLESNNTLLKSDVAAAHQGLVDKISETLEKARLEDLTGVISSAISATLSKEFGGGGERGEEEETAAMAVAAAASAGGPPNESKKPMKRGMHDHIGSIVRSSLSNTESLISALRQEMREYVAEIKKNNHSETISNHQKTSSVDTEAILLAFATVKSEMTAPLKVALADAFAQQRSALDASIKEMFSSVVAKQREQEIEISSSRAAEKACEKTAPMLSAIVEKIDAAVTLLERKARVDENTHKQHAQQNDNINNSTSSVTALADLDGLLTKRLSPLLSHQTNLSTVIETSFSRLSAELLESLRREQQEEKVRAETANDTKLSALLLERIGGIEERLAAHLNTNINKNNNSKTDSNATATATATAATSGDAATKRHVQIALKMASSSFDAAVSYYTSWWSWHRLFVEPRDKKEHDEKKGGVQDLLTSLLSTDGRRGGLEVSGAERGPQALFMAYVMAKETLYNDSVAFFVGRAPQGPQFNNVNNALHTTEDNNPPPSQRASTSNQKTNDTRPTLIVANSTITTTPANGGPNTASLEKRTVVGAKGNSYAGSEVGGGGGGNAFDDDSSEEEEERGKEVNKGQGTIMSPPTTASSSDVPMSRRSRSEAKKSNNGNAGGGTQRKGARGTNAFDDDDEEEEASVVITTAKKTLPQTKDDTNADDTLLGAAQAAARSAAMTNKSNTKASGDKAEKKSQEETKRGRAFSSSSSPSPSRRSSSLSPSSPSSSPSHSSTSLTLSSGDASPLNTKASHSTIESPQQHKIRKGREGKGQHTSGGGGGGIVLVEGGKKGSQPHLITSNATTGIIITDGADGKRTNNKALDFGDSSDDEERGPVKRGEQQEKAPLAAAPDTIASGNTKKNLNYSSDSSSSPSRGERNGGGGGGDVSTDVSGDSAKVGGGNAENNNVAKTAQEDLEARRRRLFGFDDENDDNDGGGGQNGTAKTAIGSAFGGGVAAVIVAAATTTQRSSSALLSSGGGGGGISAVGGTKPTVAAASSASSSSKKKALPMW